ncbi:cytochrome P450 [Nonomuraea sp. NPDC049480]|uniref:cytochrome P450 n=1 Tax=Nonomuraea sp. NPDC049480 TaxID=3364353 RepID=UPI0037ACC9F6
MGTIVLPAAMVLGEQVVDRAFSRMGGMFGLWIPGVGNAVMLRDPALIRQVMLAPADVIDDYEVNRVQSPVIGRQGLAVLDRAQNRCLRQIMTPALRPEALLRLRELTALRAQRLVDECPVGTPFALGPRLRTAMMETILTLIIGEDRSPAFGEWIRVTTRMFQRAVSAEITVRYMLRHVGGLALWPSFRRSMDVCDRLIYTEIDRRRHRGEDRDDLLGVLMRARDDRGAQLTDQALRDQVMSIIAGARTTAATGIAWAFERVVRHPEVLRRLTAESDAAAQDVYAGAVSYEALRVRPPVAFFGRKAQRPFELGGRLLRPGTAITIHLRALHHDPGLYPDPTAFRPERWLSKRPGGYGWMPFGGGQRTCIGDRLTLMLMKTFLHVFTRSAVLSPAEPRDEPIKWRAISNLPGHDCRIVVCPRTTAP